MVDILGLGLIVVGSYILIKYGPQIASNIQAGQPALAGVVPTAQAATQPVTGDVTGGAGAAAPTVPASLNCPQRCQCINVGGNCVCQGNINCPCSPCSSFQAAPPRPPSGFVEPGHGPLTSRLTPIEQGIKPGSGVRRQPTTCHGIKCGPGTGLTCTGLGCPRSDALVGYFQGYSIPVEGPQWYRTIPAREYQANMTQVINGKTLTTIDEYMPAGFVLGQANARSNRAAAYQ